MIDFFLATGATTFNFGQTGQTSTTQASTGFAGFGQTPATTTATASSGFGSSIFGQQPQQQQQTSLFSGTTGAQPLGGSFLSSTTTGGQASGLASLSNLGQNQSLLSQTQANTTTMQITGLF